MRRGRVGTAVIEQGVVPRAAYRQTGLGRKLVVESPEDLVRPAREGLVDVEARVRTVVGVGLWLPLVFVTPEEMHPALHDRAVDGLAHLLIRIGEDAVRDEVLGVELVAPEIARKRAGEAVRPGLGDGIHEHPGGSSVAGVKPVRDHLKLRNRIPAVAWLLAVRR